MSDSDAWAVTDALAKLVANSLTVSDASLLHAETYGALTSLSSMTVSDTASNIAGDLTGGISLLETGAVDGTITAITVNDAVVALTDIQAEAVHHALAILGGGRRPDGQRLCRSRTSRPLPDFPRSPA